MLKIKILQICEISNKKPLILMPGFGKNPYHGQQ